MMLNFQKNYYNKKNAYKVNQRRLERIESNVSYG